MPKHKYQNNDKIQMRMENSSTNIRYLRISVTDRCNMRCRYCMPKGYTERAPSCETLTHDEISAAVDAGTRFGLDTVRVTGGEPLLRPDITTIIARISSNPALKRVCVTTNGTLLAGLVNDLHNAGLNSVNISLDTLRRKRYEEISGRDLLPKALSGIAEAKRSLAEIKLNMVVMRHINDDEIADFCSFADKEDIIVRFIEFMPHLDCATDFLFSGAEVLSVVEKRFGKVSRSPDTFGLGPAQYYRAEGLKNPFGIIASVTSPACESCNRLRLTSDGRLMPCLYAANHFDLKGALMRNEDPVSVFASAIDAKKRSSRPMTCRLEKNMAELGG
jgi:cyclic pyranopterin phosphate synthase